MRSLAIAFFAALPLVWAQTPAAPAKKMDPIQWSASAAAPAADGKFVVTLKATSEAGWHLYSMTTPRPPIATSAKVEGVEGVEVFQPAPIRKLDKNFEAETETFEGETVFYVQGQLPAGTKLTTVNVRYQACDDRQCLPPRKKAIEIGPGAAAVIPAGYAKVASPAAAAPAAAASSSAAGDGRLGAVSADRLWLWPCGPVYSVRLPDDPDHDVFLPGAIGRPVPRAADRSGLDLLPGNRVPVYPARL
jgi:hypothetical protein